VVRKATLEGQLIIRNFSHLNPKIQVTFNGDFTVGRTADAAANGMVFIRMFLISFRRKISGLLHVQ
jgi:hypothetical protein